MKWFPFVFCCCLLLIGGESTAAEPKGKAARELKWAKGIADDFWDAMLGEDSGAAAAGLLSPELRQTLQKDKDGEIKLLSAIQWECTYLFGKKLKADFTSQELAPDKKEAVFKGTLSEKAVVKADFTLRVAKEGGSGKWSIRFIRLNPRDSTPPPAAPAPAPARSPDTPRSQAGSGDGSGNPPARRADSAPRPSK